DFLRSCCDLFFNGRFRPLRPMLVVAEDILRRRQSLDSALSRIQNSESNTNNSLAFALQIGRIKRKLRQSWPRRLPRVPLVPRSSTSFVIDNHFAQVSDRTIDAIDPPSKLNSGHGVLKLLLMPYLVERSPLLFEIQPLARKFFQSRALDLANRGFNG